MAPRNILAEDGAASLPISAVRPWFEADPTLWREMIVAAPPPGSRRFALFLRSALYRVFVLGKERRSRSGRTPHDPIEELDSRSMELGERLFDEFRSRHGADVRIVIWTPPAELGPSWLDDSDVLQIDLNPVEPRPDLVDIAEIHPGARSIGGAPCRPLGCWSSGAGSPTRPRERNSPPGITEHGTGESGHGKPALGRHSQKT
jgi:hypothetical protein